MKKKISRKHNHLIIGSESPLSRPKSKKAGVLKRFLDWIAKGSKNTCPT